MKMTSIEVIQSKIFNCISSFIPVLDKWKREGDSVVFTNGCFDLVHLGHLKLLSRAADFGDRLIVGLNTDASIKLFKGTDRPFINQQSRAFLLASMFMIDAVILFNEATPIELIQIIQPDILVKGNDYQTEEIVGADFVFASGGRVERVELTNGFSTTNLIERIRKRH